MLNCLIFCILQHKLQKQKFALFCLDLFVSLKSNACFIVKKKNINIFNTLNNKRFTSRQHFTCILVKITSKVFIPKVSKNNH